MVLQLWKDIFTFNIAIQHVGKKNYFVVLTFWSIDYNSVAHFELYRQWISCMFTLNTSNWRKTIEIILWCNIFIFFSTITTREKKINYTTDNTTGKFWFVPILGWGGISHYHIIRTNGLLKSSEHSYTV